MNAGSNKVGGNDLNKTKLANEEDIVVSINQF